MNQNPFQEQNDEDEFDDDMEIVGDDPHSGLDPFATHGTDGAVTTIKNNNDTDIENEDPTAMDTEEGFLETRPNGDFSEENLLNDQTKKSDDEDDKTVNNSIFGKMKRPTLAETTGEPSHNIPRRINYSIPCGVACFVGLSCLIFFIWTIFDVIWIEYALQSLLHWINDRDAQLGLASLIFCIFDVCILMIAGGADVIIILGCGFLYGTQIGTIIFAICSFIGSIVAFLIGKTLFRDTLYQFFSTYEIYRLIDRSIQDYAIPLVFGLRLCPFLPMGFISYILSCTSVTLRDFMIGHVGIIPCTVVLAYAGTLEYDVDFLKVTTYTHDSLPYAIVVLSSVFFAIITVTTSYLIYKQYERLLIGDNRRANMENSESEHEESLTAEEHDSLEAGGLKQKKDNIIDIELQPVESNSKGDNLHGNGSGDSLEDEKDDDIKDIDNKSKKSKKSKLPSWKKINIPNISNKHRDSFFYTGWDNEQAGVAMQSPFGEGRRTTVGSNRAHADSNAAPMDPSTPKAGTQAKFRVNG